MPDNPTEQRQLELLRRHIGRVREHAISAADALHTPQAEQWPPVAREHLEALIGDCMALIDVHDINPQPEGAARFWSHVTRPVSNAVGLHAPCWPCDFARLKDKNGTRGIAVVHWRGRMRPASHVAYELEFGHPIPEDMRLRRNCADKTCCNVRQHYEAHPMFAVRIPPADDPLLVAIGEASEEVPLCRAGHHLRPGQLARNCAECRTERRARQSAAQNAAWRATYFGEVQEPPPNGKPSEPARSEPEPIPDALSAGPPDSLDDLDAAIRAMFEEPVTV